METLVTPAHSLGILLKAEGLLGEETVVQALAIQARTGDRLGQILTHQGALKTRELYRALARQQEIPLINLVETPPDNTLLHPAMVEDYLRHRMLPWRREADGSQTVALVEWDEASMAKARQMFGRDATCVLTTPYDLIHALNQQCGAVLDDHARNHLLRTQPLCSAQPQQRPLALMVTAALVSLWWVVFHPGVLPWFLAVANVFFLATLLLKLGLFAAAFTARPLRTPKRELARMEEGELPLYTILVPLYKEAASIPRLINALCALDYPPTRLDIKLIVESDDAATLHAIKKAAPPAGFEIIRVPYSEPRTKPKACNYALRFARGEFVTIFDAEDAPEPGQLKKAIYWFRRLPEEVVCLQARLNYYNRRENLLTALFALEYATLFDFLLPGLYRLGMPIPLGGTSNHFRMAALKALGEWDPYNVTEDADLGIRLAARGLKTMPLDALTLEEAPLTLGAWLKQRSRWIKGYMVTWLVAMRRPRTLWRELGSVGFIGFQLFVGGASVVYLITPVLWGMMLLWVSEAIPSFTRPPEWLEMSCLGMLGAGIIIQWALVLWVAAMRLWWDQWLALLLFPFYWFLHSVACYRALWQLLTAPFYWEKTEHALTSMAPKMGRRWGFRGRG